MNILLHKVKNYSFLNLGMQFFLLSFKHLMIAVLRLPKLKPILNNIYGVKYHFVVPFSVGRVYNKVKDNKIQLNFLKCSSLVCSFHLKNDVFDRHRITFFSERKCISSD